MKKPHDSRLLSHNSKNSDHLIQCDIIAFIVDRQARQLSHHTIRYYEMELDLFCGWCLQCDLFSIEAITPTHLRSYMVHLGVTRNPGGVHAGYRSIKALLNWYELETDNDAWPNPIRKISAPKVDKMPKPGIPPAHIKALLHTCNSSKELDRRDRAIILTLLDTGLRRSEICALNYGDLDLKTGAVQVRAGKGNKDRVVYMGARSRCALIRYLRHRDELFDRSPLWTTQHGKRLSPSGLRQILRRRSARANIPEPQIHDFRRSFAIESLRNGMNIIELMHIMGHTSTVVLQRYLALVDSDLRRAHARSSPADHLK